MERLNHFDVRLDYFASWGGDEGPEKVSEKELPRLHSENKEMSDGFGNVALADLVR